MGRFNNIKKNRKDYMLHHSPPVGTFQMDIMNETGDPEYHWLIMIDVGSRKVWAQQIMSKNANSVENALKKLVPEIRKDGAVINIIRGDQEKSFVSNQVLNWLWQEHIEFSPVPTYDGSSNHTSLAVVDRVTRTLKSWDQDDRDGYKSVLLNPRRLQEIIERYNNTPHTTLTRYLGRPVSPNQVNGFDRENMKAILDAQNMETMSRGDYRLKDDQKVSLYRDTNVYDKAKRTNRFAGDFYTAGTQGAFTLVANSTGEDYKVPRWRINTEK
jgi:hypothetical protein